MASAVAMIVAAAPRAGRWPGRRRRRGPRRVARPWPTSVGHAAGASRGRRDGVAARPRRRPARATAIPAASGAAPVGSPPHASIARTRPPSLTSRSHPEHRRPSPARARRRSPTSSGARPASPNESRSPQRPVPHPGRGGAAEGDQRPDRGRRPWRPPAPARWPPRATWPDQSPARPAPPGRAAHGAPGDGASGRAGRQRRAAPGRGSASNRGAARPNNRAASTSRPSITASAAQPARYRRM